MVEVKKLIFSKLEGGRMRVLFIVVSWLFFSLAFGQPKEDQVFNQPGKPLGDGVYKYSWPRTDLKVTIEDVDVEAGLALGSWAVFHQEMVMGDLVLLPREVNPVISELQAGGFQILAIHNHLIDETPQVVYVHFSAKGESEKLADTLKRSLAKTTTASKPPPKRELSSDGAKAFEIIQEVLLTKGSISGTILNVSIPRAERIQMHNEEILPSMGMAIAMNFQFSNGEVATAGDFVLTAEEVNPVITELQKNHINVTALHNHMLDEIPRLFFMHFWAVGKPESLANGFKAALTKVHVKKGA